jgi:large subunit ribosomal protein L30
MIETIKIKTIKITLVKSLIGRLDAHKACARGLGLRKIRQSVEVAATKENLGMINRINYLLKCEG